MNFLGTSQEEEVLVKFSEAQSLYFSLSSDVRYVAYQKTLEELYAKIKRWLPEVQKYP